MILKEFDRKNNKDVIKFLNELKSENLHLSFTDYKDDDELLEILNNPKNIFYICIENDDIIGIFRAKIGDSYKSHSAFITAAIKKDCRSNGVGKAITNFALDDLKSKGIKIARTLVYSNNKKSLNTLLSCGFTIGGSVIMHHYSDELNGYVDDIILHKIL